MMSRPKRKKKATTTILLSEVFGGQDFERNDAMKLFVIGLIDRAHAASAYRLHYSVVRDCFFRKGFHYWESGDQPSLIQTKST